MTGQEFLSNLASLTARAREYVLRNRRFHLAFGLFLIAGAYGPLNVLMSSPAGLPSWFSSLMIVLLSGALASSLYLLWGNLKILLPLVLLLGSCLIFNEQIEYYFTGERSLKAARSNQPDNGSEVVDYEAIASSRVLAGSFLVLLLGFGATLTLVTVLKQRKEKERSDAVQRIARQLKSSFPPRDTIRTTWYEIHGNVAQGETAGGDIVDIIPINPSSVLVLAGTVEETGIAAGAMTSILSAGVRSMLTGISHSRRPDQIDLSRVIEQIDALLLDLTGQANHFPLTLLLLDKRTRSAVLTRRGSPPIFHVKPPNLWLGKKKKEGERRTRVRPKVTVRAGTFQYEKDDRIVAFGDGIVKLGNESGEEYGIQRLKNSMLEFSMHPVSDWNELLLSRAKEFTAHQPLQRDIATITIHFL